MITKLAYVLTCAPDNNYIEQALLSVFTARFYNPDAEIVLITDDLTDTVITGKRAELLKYFSEKIVVKLDPDLSMMQRSRWLKTSLRNLIKGDFLFIDSDTLITGSLQEIDKCEYNIAAVPESHLPVNKFNKYIFEKVDELSKKIGWNLNQEKYYFSSGVIYVKDFPENYEFYNKWFTYWFKGLSLGISIDQPSFAKANIKSGHPVKELDGIWNCVMYTHVEFAYSAKILHFCSFRNMSYIFENNFLEKVKIEGVENNEFIKYSLINPYMTFIPFDNVISKYGFKDFILMIKNLKKISYLVSINLDNNFNDFIGANRIELTVKNLFRKKMFLAGSLLLTVYKFYKTKVDKRYRYVSNTCAADNF